MDEPFVMLVDDEEEFVDAMSRRLEVREVAVIACLSGDEAVEKLRTHRNVDVVILDVKMPGMSGIDTLKVIKEELPLIEVIMLTGHATVETAVEGMKLGAFDYLMKPCEIDTLLAKVREAAEKKREHEERIRDAMVRNALKGGPL